jgi:hypothetical protein
MRRIQIYMEEALDELLEAEAARTGSSKAALIRDCVAHHYRGRRRRDDPINRLVGAFGGDPVEDIDEVVYGS